MKMIERILQVLKREEESLQVCRQSSTLLHLRNEIGLVLEISAPSWFVSVDWHSIVVLVGLEDSFGDYG